MNSPLKDTSRRLEWLRFGLVAIALIGVITFILMTNSEPVEAAPEVTLHSGDQLIVSGEACSLVLINATQARARMRCDAFTTTAAATAVVSAPDAKIRRTIKAGKKLNAQAAVECKLKVVEETASQIRIKCKPKPVTPTATPTNTRTPTRTKTPGTSQTNLYIGNYTGGTLCYEVFNTGVGRKCFGAGDSFYGSFPSGVYTYKVEAVCGSLSETVNYPSGDRIHNWECTAGISARSGDLSQYRSAPDAFATPSR